MYRIQQTNTLHNYRFHRQLIKIMPVQKTKNYCEIISLNCFYTTTHKQHLSHIYNSKQKLFLQLRYLYVILIKIQWSIYTANSTEATTVYYN